MTQEVRTDDDQTPRPEPVGDRTEDDRGQVSVEADDRTPEEAGYGYGV